MSDKKTAVEGDDFDISPEEIARVMREVANETTRLQETINEALREFGNAWNKILDPKFREFIYRFGAAADLAAQRNQDIEFPYVVKDGKLHRVHKPVRGPGVDRMWVDEVQEFDRPIEQSLWNGKDPLFNFPIGTHVRYPEGNCKIIKHGGVIDCPLVHRICTQCGRDFSASACGPTHAMIYAEWEQGMGEKRSYGDDDQPLFEG